MNFAKVFLILSASLFWVCVFAQQLPPEGIESVSKRNNKPPEKFSGSSHFNISASIGAANYLGDLTENNKLYSQSGFAFGIGASYSFSNNFSTRLDLGVQKLQAADSKNNSAQLRDRNLSFKSNVFDVSLSAEYCILNLNKYPLSPFLSAGVGVMFFNPYTNDAAGNKQFLRELGTEGQGLAAYPDRKIYNKSAVEFPLGIGIKIAASQQIILQLEFDYRITGTDYLDDVSTTYPDKALLDARNPLTAAFTYRGTGAYPTNLNLARGNPQKKDVYYTTLFKVVYAFNKKPKVKPVKSAQVINGLPKDRDFDGTPDSLDRCPDIAGPASLRGCPDSIHNGIADRDGDGVADADDLCPDTHGTVENKGCPIPFVEGAELSKTTPDSMTYRIYFDFERSNLLPDGFKALKNIVDILNADKSLTVGIAGYSDNLGTSKASTQISAERSKIVKDYFLSYFIDASRISTAYYGSKRPANSQQQWLNRRVEITLIKN